MVGVGRSARRSLRDGVHPQCVGVADTLKRPAERASDGCNTRLIPFNLIRHVFGDSVSPKTTLVCFPLTMNGSKFVLVTGATGFIGAHVVDTLLERGIKVRGATRSIEKGNAMANARSQHAASLEFVQIQDFENPGGLEEAVQGVDGVIHVASVRCPMNLCQVNVADWLVAVYL